MKRTIVITIAVISIMVLIFTGIQYIKINDRIQFDKARMSCILQAVKAYKESFGQWPKDSKAALDSWPSESAYKCKEDTFGNKYPWVLAMNNMGESKINAPVLLSSDSSRYYGIYRIALLADGSFRMQR